MEWYDIGIDGQHTVKFADLPYVPLKSPPLPLDTEEIFLGRKQGGILRHGEWAWLTRNSVLQIVSLRSGQTISSYEFCESRGYESYCIRCVEEILPNNPESMLLAVVLESFSGPGGGCSYVAVYSVESSSVLSSVELSLHITCARFMDASACRRSLLQNFDGCLAVGSEEGVIVLLNMNLQKLMSTRNEMLENESVPCHIFDYSLPLTEVHRNFRQCQQNGIYFGLQMEVIESPCSIKSLLPIDLILGLAIGLEDGRLALYDLAELQIFYVVLPNPEVTMSPLVKMDFLEPPDDPRPCLFIWTLHENGENLHAVLHNLMYEKRVMGEDESSTCFETFVNGSVRLQLPLEATKSEALACQAISTFSNHGEDDSNCLCAISWLSVLESKNKLLIFDLNQWYKEEMPYVLQYGKQPNYLAGYILNGECTGLHTLVNSNNIAHFNSMQRYEEHFYPNSLSFESFLVHTDGCRRYNWEGAQNRVINLLRSSNAAIFLEPNIYFNEIMRTRLIPQFTEMNFNSTFSRNAKYEILLSTALEQNCVSLLRDCAKSWLDGSFMGNFSASTGLSLSTLTDWIWKRATCIKSRCNDLCKSLFEFGGYPLDSREQKELGFITRQLKLLCDLLKEILAYAKKQIPEKVFNDLENKYRSLLMASGYQDILLWLLNIGLLPEASPHNDKITANTNCLIPYPYKELKEFYRSKRQLFAKISETFISKKSGSCKLLFIDSFIEHMCKGNILHEYWLENEGDGLYPPNSLEAMLRVMLVPDLSHENKCAILLYFFLDLNMAIDEEVYKDVVANFIKYPSVFKLSAPLIKTVQAFWNLDHDHYLPAVDEFISPFNKNQCYPQWQVELLIEVLLNQQASNLALRILESQPSLISPLLKLNTLLANELISEAFHFVRSKNDDTLFETFFTRCLRNGRFGVIRDLALSEREGLILQNILKKSKAPGAESLHFVYLLQKSKYLEAVSYMDELSNKAKGIKSSLQEMDTPNLVLSAFNTTMTPVTQGLTDVYFRIKNKIKKKEFDNKSPVPLSCQLIKQNANALLGGIYHSSALSAHFATYYWGEMEEQTKQTRHLLSVNNAPFLRRPQIETTSMDYMGKNNISYPQAYKVKEKRTLVESGVVDNELEEFERHKLEHKLNPKKKRRLIGREIVDDLSHLMKISKNSNSLNASEFTFDAEQTSEPKEQARKNSLDLLARPLITKRTTKDLDDIILMPEIHSILKTHSSDIPGQHQREPLVEEEKNLRFTLPPADVSTVEVTLNEESIEEENNLRFTVPSADVSTVEVTLNEESIEDVDVTQEEKLQEQITKSPKSKDTTRAPSEESNKSSIASSYTSEDNFYSPLSSQNNSKLDSSNVSKYSFLSGPQPRKPLARLSSERLEKALTPELEIETRNSSSCIKSSSSHCETTLEPALKSQNSPRNSTERIDSSSLKETTTRGDNFGSTASSNAAYVTAYSSAFKSKISPRRSLERFNADHLNKAGTSEASEKADTFSKTTTLISSPNLKEEVTPATSGFCSIGSLATFGRSKINEFSPQVSSSKVGEENKPLTECSTVLGSLTTFECTNTISNVGFAASKMPLSKTKSNPDQPTEDQKRHMLETTLSMSTYEFSILDSSSGQQTRSSSLMVTAKDVISKLESGKSNENKLVELAEEEEGVEEDDDDDDEDMEYEEQHKEKEKLDEMQEALNVLQQAEASNYDCIVLSSSSSASSSPSSPSEEPEDAYYKNPYFDEDMEDEIENADNIEDDENSDFGESNQSAITNEIFGVDDYDDEDEDNSKEPSTEDTNSSTDIDDIQLIEDTSSDDHRLQEGNYSGESDSEDVRVLEYDDHVFLAVEDEAASPNVNTEESAAIEEAQSKVDEDLEINATDANKSSLAEVNLFEGDNAISPEYSQPSDITAGKACEIEIRTPKDINTSTNDLTEVLEQKDIVDDVTRGDQEDKQQDLVVGKMQADTESDSKAVLTSTENEVKTGEKQTIKSSNSVKNSQMINIDIRIEENVNLASTKVISPSKDIKENDITGKITHDDAEQDATKKEQKETDIRISENVSLSTPEVITESDDMKHNDIADDTIHDDREDKHDATKEGHKKSEDHATDVTKTKCEVMPLKKVTIESFDSIEIVEATEEQTITLKKDDKDSQVGCKVAAEKKETDNVGQQSKVCEEKKNKEELLAIKKVSDNSLLIPMDVELKVDEIPSTSHKRAAEEKSELDTTKDKVIEEKESKDEQNVTTFANEVKIESTQRMRKQSGEYSVAPSDPELKAAAEVSTPRRNKRGISVPPQANIDSEEFANLTPRTRHHIRASSLQPKSKIKEEDETSTPRKIQKKQDIKSSNMRTTRGSSLPPDAVDTKITSRRGSVLVDAINENSATLLDSPATRTRLRSRLNSMESELDSPIIASTEHLTQLKRTRTTSITSNSGDLPVTPKRLRRDSTNSQAEASAIITMPRSLRGRSILSVQEEGEDTETIPASPKPASNKRFDMKRKKSNSEESSTDYKEQFEQNAAKDDQPALSEASYSSSRRLTRTQLAIMEKSAALLQASTQEAVATETISPPSNKRPTKARSTRSSNTNADSDDAASVSSKLSTVSSVTGTRRRVTRSSVKGKDDDDDRVSIASSFGSEKHHARARRSKDKNSPSTTLTTIPEDAPIETKKRGRPTKH